MDSKKGSPKSSVDKSSLGDSEMNDQFEGTRVDLGDDLLDVTKTRPGLKPNLPERETAVIARADPDEVFKSAEILFHENLLDESKSALRQILTQHPDHVASFKLLEKIHQLELRQIFSESRREFGQEADRKKPHLLPESSEEVIEKLHRDFSIASDNPESLLAQIYHSPEFETDVEKNLAGINSKDRIDLGIGFLEIGLFTLAIGQFHRARDASANERPEDSVNRASAIILEAFTQLLMQKPFEGLQTLEPLLVDAEVTESQKLEIFYLMGRCSEATGNHPMALEWYLNVIQRDPSYRDVIERNRRLKIQLRKESVGRGPGQ